MKKSVKDDSKSAAAGEMHDQEVLRANRELAAYFEGLRTEREARAALKIIKAFIKERERVDAGRRRPLPGLEPVAAPKHAATRTRRKGAETAGRKPRRHVQDRTLKDYDQPQAGPETNDTRAPEDSIERE
jgi:hypothetical protein